MTVINTNVKSLVAADAINGNNNRLSQAMQRLSTGLRVNSAKDDAAGLSIGTKMDAQIRGLNMAIKNANDGASLLQTADDSMGQVTSALQRMRELAVQASNATNTDQDRASLDAEVQQLKSMIDTIASKTQFNGINLLDGSFANKKLLVGDKADNLLNLSIGNISTSSLGTPAPLAKGVVITGRIGDLSTLSGGTNNILINGTAVNAISADSSSPAGATLDIADMVAAINTSNVGVTATAFNQVVADNVGTGVSTNTVTITVTSLDDGEDTTINLNNTTSLQDMVDQINRKGGPHTVEARINEEGKLVLFNDTGAKIAIADSGTPDATGFGAGDSYNGFVKIASTTGEVFSIKADDDADYSLLGLNQMTADGVVKGNAITPSITDWPSGSLSINGVDIWYHDINSDVVPSSALDVNGLVNAINKFTSQTGVSAGLYDIGGTDFGLTLKSADNSPIQIKMSSALRTAGDLGLVETNVGAVDFDSNRTGSFGSFAGGRAVGTVDVLSQNSALSSISVIDGALNKVSMQRANIGAIQNRIEATVTNLSNVVTNTQASRSRIMDADYATETTNLARAQIIQQAATAMLAQANQSSQTVLSLLK